MTSWFKRWRGLRKAKKMEGKLLTGFAPDDIHNNITEDKRVKQHINEDGVWRPVFDEDEMKIIFEQRAKEKSKASN